MSALLGIVDESVCVCIVCGCEDFDACENAAGETCEWAWSDPARGIGVCSFCAPSCPWPRDASLSV